MKCNKEYHDSYGEEDCPQCWIRPGGWLETGLPNPWLEPVQPEDKNVSIEAPDKKGSPNGD